MINRRLKKAFDKWTTFRVNYKLRELSENNQFQQRVILTKLNVLNSLFKANTIEFCFEKWRSKTIITHKLKKLVIERKIIAHKNPKNL